PGRARRGSGDGLQRDPRAAGPGRRDRRAPRGPAHRRRPRRLRHRRVHPPPLLQEARPMSTRTTSRLASYGTLIGLLLLVVLFAALDSRGIFLTTGNLTNVLEQIAVLAMVAAVQ